MPTVASIFTSTVKSLSLEEPASVMVGHSGIADDRRFHLIDAEGRLLTQRQKGLLVLVKAEYSADSGVLTLEFPDGERVTGQAGSGGPVSTVIWGRRVTGRQVSGPWNEALSEFCGSPVRLVKTVRPGESYDEYPISIVSQESIDFLGNRRADGGIFEGRRFRPNFLIEGCSPHEEDSWLGGVVQIGPELRIRLVAPDPRCAITTLDPETGLPDFDVPNLLLSYRPGSRAAYFGVYGSVENPGAASVGDTVELVQAPR
ncbi:MAG: MOSC domain-containing protein [Chloroflexi bacterium]|nr:MOSC domain-containing protein [Chloroflexota bacterium]MDA1271873.1 MOSC domain-containing protein [Chloroflexota bacterium]